MAGSGVGRGGGARMRHVLSQGRALPLAWRVRPCPKGPVPADLPIAWGELVLALSPAGTQGVCLGDGACDGIPRPETRNEAGWGYAGRTSTGHTATWADEPLHGNALGACLTPGRLIALKEGAWPREAYGPVRLRCCWAQGPAAPWYVVRNRSAAEEARDSEKKRFRLETFFSAQPRRGCNMHTSP